MRFAMTRASQTFGPRASVHTAVRGGLLLLAAFAVTPAHGFDAFEVEGARVDVTGNTAAAAREVALAEGERKAMRRLLERLTLRVDHDRLPKLDREVISTYVQDFSVAEEKLSAVRYIAALNYRFRASDVRELLQAYDIPFAETPSKPVLVLPVYRSAGALLLWDEPNRWRMAWDSLPPRDGLVPLMLPLGDLADIALIGAEQALQGDLQRLQDVATRYGAGDTIVALATLGIDPASATRRVEVSVTRYGSILEARTSVLELTAKDGENDHELLRRAAAELASVAEDNWKTDNLLQFGSQAVVAVTVPIGGLVDWLLVRKRLGKVAVISRTDLVLVSREEVRVNFHYIGDLDQLVLALEQLDLRLARDGDEWVLRVAAGPVGGKS